MAPQRGAQTACTDLSESLMPMDTLPTGLPQVWGSICCSQLMSLKKGQICWKPSAVLVGRGQCWNLSIQVKNMGCRQR